ncbi:serine hydrolase domain-containing protein [Arthrobacter sp. StoSoilA2]|uniref:serine hydrolase domain-containing protein n=1 Tax=Arthrobacter sp. StoSoilA2 TaxID=2830990 RepID=UPI001CC700CE|nr:serine hydrolase domain-containing protein [Arthrobacter sp. StoSoilA2]
MTSSTAAPPTVPAPPPTSTSQSPPVTPAFRELQATLELFSREMLQNGAPAVLMEARAGQQVWRHAAGVRSLDGGAPVQADDPIRVGGLTRTMVAVCVLKLVEEGRLVLEDPIAKYLPGIGVLLPPGQESVTVRQLLDHTSGTSYASGLSDYAVLGFLVERLRGAPLGTVLRTDILDPLNLHSTKVLDEGPLPAALVHGYAVLRGKTVDVTHSAQPGGPASEGVIASVADINAFYAALLKGRLLLPESLLEMKGPVFADYGLGLDHWKDTCTNGLYYGHSGDIPGYGTISISSADGNRQLTISLAYPPLPLSTQPSAIALELTGLAQVALNASCRFQFR